MAWPQAPQPAPAPPAARPSVPLGPLVTAGGAFLTFVFSFVRIYKIEAGGEDAGWSVWTTDFSPGLFGVGTLIPFFAILAGALALGRAFAGLDQKPLAGFTALQLQLVAAANAAIIWFGFLVSIVLSDGGFDVKLGLGMLLLFLGLAAVIAGTVLSVLDQKKGTTTGISTTPGGTPPGSYGTPAPGYGTPAPGSYGTPAPGAPGAPGAYGTPGTGQWPAATPPPPPGGQPAPQQWPAQPGAPAPQPGWDPNAPAAPGQWQPDPTGAPAPQPGWNPPPPPQQAWSPPAASDPYQPQPQPPAPSPEPGPLDPQPAPPVSPGGPAQGGGALIDPGTEVIPGPPPAPPSEPR